MIRLYTDLKYFNNLFNGVLIVDSYFNSIVNSTAMFSDVILDYLRKYEHAEVIDDKLLNGRFGKFTIDGLSTGVKTLIILKLMDEGKLEIPDFINISGCGENILSDVLFYVEKLEIPVYFRNSDIIGLEDFDVIVNNEYKFDNVIDLLSYLATVY